MKKVFVGSDQGGFDLKKSLLEKLRADLKEFEFVDLGSHSQASVDYPDFAAAVAREVVKEKTLGILLCGTGIGMAIAANKIKGVRAAVVWDATSARLSREHNDANILCMGGRMLGSQVALEAASLFLKTAFEADRHTQRLAKIEKIEKGG